MCNFVIKAKPGWSLSRGILRWFLFAALFSAVTLFLFSLWKNQQIKGRLPKKLDKYIYWVNTVLLHKMCNSSSAWSKTGRSGQRPFDLTEVSFLCFPYSSLRLWLTQNMVLCLSEFLEGYNKLKLIVMESMRKKIHFYLQAIGDEKL